MWVPNKKNKIKKKIDRVGPLITGAPPTSSSTGKIEEIKAEEVENKKSFKKNSKSLPTMQIHAS